MAKLLRAGTDTVRTTAMIFALIIAAEVFSNFVNFAGLPDAILTWVNSLELSAYVVMLALICIYLLLGAVLESLSMILLTVPIFFPLVSSLDFGGVLADPTMVVIWFGIIVVVVTEISLISPPIGLNVFVLKTVLQDVQLQTIFKGVTAFWLADILRLILLLSVPALSLIFLIE